MDRHDVQLLNMLQQNNRLTTEQLSKATGLSPTSCQRRLKLLRKKGIIKADISVISADAVGRSMTMVVQVCLEHDQPEHLDRFKRAMLAIPEVMQCYYVTGNIDFILILTAKDMRDYEAFTRRVFFANPNIKNFITNVVIDQVKVGLNIPLDANEVD
ncbi:MAG: Lrp/AsnC family transcriptional regulator [Desulfuromonadales bacterium]|jgi:Lrp/AsnC family transcriptional regulator, leucine-responsive regulatory protein